MVFYFTGTGNCLYAAEQFDEKRISIAQIVNSETLDFTAERIGIVCPVYGHEMPEMVKKFISKAVFHTDYFYIVLTYGNRRANAVELANNTLKAVGKRADYITTLLMADNFLPAFDMSEQAKKDKGEEAQIAEIKAHIEAKRQGMQKVTRKDRAIHKQYLSFVGNAPETVWADFGVTEECIGCGICTKVCPGGCIHLEKQKAVHNEENCQACMACIHACPKLAIKMNLPEKNPAARYRNEHISLAELVAANNQTEN